MTPKQTAPTEPTLTAEDVLTPEALELWGGDAAKYNDVPESRIIRCATLYRKIGGPQVMIDAKTIEKIYLAYLEEYPCTKDGWDMIHAELSHTPAWVWGNYATAVLGRKMDLPDVEAYARPDGLAEVVCPLCDRKFVPRASQMIGKDGKVLLTDRGEQIVHGNYFVCYFRGKLTMIAVCGFPRKHSGVPKCYEAVMEETAWKGVPQLGHTKANAEKIFAIRQQAQADWAKDRAPFDALGVRPPDDRRSNQSAGEQIFGRGTGFARRDERGATGGDFGNRGEKRQFQR